MISQPLTFLGKHGCFSTDQNSAYFTTPEKEFVLIDCPPSSYYEIINEKNSQLKKEIWESKSIYVLITHTHGDHLGGLDMLIHYAHWALKKDLHVIAPSDQVKHDINTWLRIAGCLRCIYHIQSANKVKNKPWFKRSIPTTHVDELDGKCFGYLLVVNGIECVFTGDTATIEPYLPYITEKTYLYADTAFRVSGVHLNIKDSLPIYAELAKNGTKIFLMHTDCDKEIQEYINNSGMNHSNISFLD